MHEIKRIGVLASHRGSNARAVLEARAQGRLDVDVALIISNNRDAEVLGLARQYGVPALHIGGKAFEDPAVRDEAIHAALTNAGCELILLAGYLKLLGPRTLSTYRNRVLNIHPALLPKYGGQGMFGLRVHEAVLAAGEKETGVSVHLVNERYDEGTLLAQVKVPVLPGDTAASLAERVLGVEHPFLVETLRSIVTGQLLLPAQ